jgi:hypothetical protein
LTSKEQVKLHNSSFDKKSNFSWREGLHSPVLKKQAFSNKLNRWKEGKMEKMERMEMDRKGWKGWKWNNFLIALLPIFFLSSYVSSQISALSAFGKIFIPKFHSGFSSFNRCVQ